VPGLIGFVKFTEPPAPNGTPGALADQLAGDAVKLVVVSTV